jgi:hypothetical protein
MFLQAAGAVRLGWFRLTACNDQVCVFKLLLYCLPDDRFELVHRYLDFRLAFVPWESCPLWSQVYLLRCKFTPFFLSPV